VNDVWIFASVAVRTDATTPKINVADELAAAPEIANGSRGAARKVELHSVLFIVPKASLASLTEANHAVEYYLIAGVEARQSDAHPIGTRRRWGSRTAKGQHFGTQTGDDK
jgi:hypothetical protein